MRARKLLESSAHPPEVLRVVFAAFDLAWADLRREHAVPPEHEQDERERLARALLSVSADTSDAQALKRAALAALRSGAG